MRHLRPGVTLIELILVLVVGGILTSIALAQMGRNAARQEVRNARDSVVALAACARAAAIERGDVVRLELNLEENVIRVLPGRSGEVEPIEIKNVMAEHGARMVAPDAQDALLTVCYSPRGYALLDTCTTLGNVDLGLSFQRENHVYEAVVRPLGRVERR